MLTDASMTMIEGQALDIGFEQQEAVGVERYLDMIARKTGALIACSIMLGALFGGADEAGLAAFQRYGALIGRIFQIRDDVLGIWGEKDQVVSVDDVLRLRNALEAHRKNYEFTLYRDMPHGWLNSTMPGRYREREAEQAWQQILDFMQRVHAGAFPADRVAWRFESNIATTYDFTKNVRLA